MRVLLASLHFGLLRNFESVIAELSARGHEVTLASEEADRFGGDDLAADLAARHAGVSLATVPAAAEEPAVDLGQRLRLVLDYLRFQTPAFAEFPKLRERMPERLPYFATRLDLRRLPGARAALAAIERGLPESARLAAWLDALRPDVVLLASLTHSRSIQPAVLRVAIARRIPVVACIYSWDHLSSKAHLVDVPDRILVWNETQRREAAHLHGLPVDRVLVTGAQCYDQWFGAPPSRDRDAFCAAQGLDAARPFILYACSALTPSPDEPAFVMDLIARLRGSPHAPLRDVGVLLRPHPERVHEWNGVDYQRYPNVVFRPRSGDAEAAKRDFLDALHHASAVVGVVTSAFLEAAIVGRPVLTPMVPMFAPHQQGARHFRYLLEIEDGLPIVGRTLEEHLTQLEQVLTGTRDWRPRQERFLRAFVRAGDLARPATPTFVNAVEQIAVQPSSAFRRSPGLAGRVLAPAALAATRRRAIRYWLLDEAERDNVRRRDWEVQHRQSKETARDARYAEKDQMRQERQAEEQRDRARREALKRERYRARDRARRRKRLEALAQRVVGRVRRTFGRPSA